MPYLCEFYESQRREQAVERPWHPGEVRCFDERACVLDLPAAEGAHEAPKLLLDSPRSLRRLHLERAEQSQVALIVDDPFHRGSAEGSDQLVFQVRDAHVEAELFHIGA